MATPAWSIKAVKSVRHVQEPAARMIAAIALRMIFLGPLGMLVARAFNTRRVDRRALLALLLAPCLGLLTLWVNHGRFPLNARLKLAIIATVAGVLATLLLRRNWWAGLALLAVLGLTHGQLANYAVDDDLALATRVQVDHILANASGVPEGMLVFWNSPRRPSPLGKSTVAAANPYRRTARRCSPWPWCLVTRSWRRWPIATWTR